MVVCSLGGFWACGPRSPPEGPKQRRRERERKATGTPEAADSQRAREPESQKQQSQRAREEAQGSATDGFFLYIGASFPARGARREAEIGAGGLVVCSLGCFWARGPRSPPEGPKQRRRRRRERERKATGTPEAAEAESQRGSPRECNRRALPIYRGPVPGKGRPEKQRLEPEGWLSVVWVAFGLAGPGPRQRAPSREGERGKGRQRGRRKQQTAREPESQKQQSQRAREEAQGSATDGFFLYIGASFPARGARREAEIGAGGLVVCSLGCFWARGPRSLPEGPKQRRRRRRERERKATGTPEAGLRAPVPARGPQAEKEEKEREATGTPEAAEAESQKGSPRECNRRALPIYRGPVPGKGRPEKQRLEPEGWLSLLWVAFGLAGPGPRQRAPSREGERGKGRQRGRRKQQRAREPEAAEPESQRGSPRGCNRRAFPIYRGPVPGKGRPERSRDWSRRVGGL